MIRVFIWLPEGANVGHSSLEISGPDNEHYAYISWWPADHLNLYKKASGISQSLQEDELAEERPPDASFEFEKGLDEDAIRKWWEKFKSKEQQYGLAGKNCSWAVIQALRSGGSDRYFPWYKVTVKRNIPVKTIMMPAIVTVAQYILTQDMIVVSANVVKVLNRYFRSFAKYAKTQPSLKHAAVAAGDELLPVWSPQDTFAYCLVLKENVGRSFEGKELLHPTPAT